MCRRCVNVQLLDVSGWDRWSDRIVMRLEHCRRMGQFQRLRILLMRGCAVITDSAVRGLLESLGSSLQHLDLQDCLRLGAACLPPCLDELKVLLFGYQKRRGKLAEGDIVTQIIGKKRLIAPKLEWLSLQNRLEARSLEGIERLAGTLKVLDLRGCSEIPSVEYKRCATLRGLKQLFVGTALGSDVVCEIARGCRELQVLDLSGSELSPHGIELICANLGSLEKLKLTRCTSLTNTALCSLLGSLRKLSLLDVSHCWKLSDSIVSILPPIASTNDLHVGVHNCSLDDTGLAIAISDRRRNSSATVKMSRHQELQVTPVGNKYS
ncbi:leucine rich repeat-containing protein [Babesia caballi]|uniref:Leucine rich repeat-containing protein n=1 Tax=Babesia caballi TaxID=5871 RepID=A0AAV4M3D3_BABCB|nr:leucine rich repeat-containing protein [Babesia caballi]